MKKILILMLALVTSTAFAKTPKSLPATQLSKIVRIGHKKIMLFVAPLPAVADINILDAAGNTVFEEKVKSTNGIVQPFNLSELENGNYRMVIYVGKESISHTFSLSDESNHRGLSVQL